jgi:hypothetical protein
MIALFGLVGLAGAVAAQRAGRLHDRGWSLPASGAAWPLAVAAFVLAGFAGHEQEQPRGAEEAEDAGDRVVAVRQPLSCS